MPHLSLQIVSNPTPDKFESLKQYLVITNNFPFEDQGLEAINLLGIQIVEEYFSEDKELYRDVHSMDDLDEDMIKFYEVIIKP